MPPDAKRSPAAHRRPLTNQTDATSLRQQPSKRALHGCRCDECLAHLLDADRVKVLTTVAAVIGLDVDRMIGELLDADWELDDATEATIDYWRSRVVFLVDRAIAIHLERRAS